jgi:hypothetical protein
MPDCLSVNDCLVQWINRAGAMHTPTWQEWKQDTVDSLQAYQQRRAEALRLLERTQLELLDHNLEAIEANLGKLKGLL